jgi:sugar O-acyltransferase (sialic acid O-acetyltransferase NeuD family)
VIDRVIVIGGSDQGRQAIDVLLEGGTGDVIGVLDRDLAAGSEVAGCRVLGSDDDLPAAVASRGATAFLVAVGDNFTRGRIFERARAMCPQLQPIGAVHPRASISRTARVGAGSIVMAGAVVSNGCTVGTGALLGTNASIDHDNELADFVSLGPGATTGGNVRIGEYTAVGLGADVIHARTIGVHCVIGAGALVLADVPDRVIAYGLPARVVRARKEGEPYLDDDR